MREIGRADVGSGERGAPMKQPHLGMQTGCRRVVGDADLSTELDPQGGVPPPFASGFVTRHPVALERPQRSCAHPVRAASRRDPDSRRIEAADAAAYGPDPADRPDLVGASDLLRHLEHDPPDGSRRPPGRYRLGGELQALSPADAGLDPRILKFSGSSFICTTVVTPPISGRGRQLRGVPHSPGAMITAPGRANIYTERPTRGSHSNEPRIQRARCRPREGPTPGSPVGAVS
jgi:hypothetical protein